MFFVCASLWIRMLDDQQTDDPYLYSFAEHTLPITDLVIGYGGWNAVIVSASEDRTCKVWSLSKGELLRSVVFPCIINAIVLDPGETVFYAGGKDGKIYLTALSASSSSSKSPWLHIIGSLSSGSKNLNEAVTSLAYSTSKNWLLAGSEDGSIRIWDPKNMSLIRGFNHEKGPVNNLQVIRRRKSSLPPKLWTPQNTKDADSTTEAIITQKGSSTAAEMGVAKLKHDLAESRQMTKRLKKTHDLLHEFCIDELLEGNRPSKG
ncbi:unnamed protein product [Linum tenue]|uniref:Uncharacterized protein n=1 Tax=Linum tenue TaxID=586396 RepID=A0AAV0P3G4_9ROSI|nr:unnamed protein product [Linum tenue]